MRYQVALAETAKQHLAAIKDKRVQGKLIKAMSSLATEPAKRGKSLSEEFVGYYSMRSVGQRYRVIYRIEDKIVTVIVVALGIRKQGDKKDAYQLAKKLVKQGLL